MFKRLSATGLKVQGVGKNRSKQRFVWLVVGALAIAAAKVALATPSSNVLSATVFARSAFQVPIDIKIKADNGSQEVIHIPRAQETVVQQIVIGPRGQTGWHSHPGPAIVLVRAGALTLYDADDPTCFGSAYTAGQAFVDHGQGHVHLAANLSSDENAEVWVTYLDVPPGAPFRIDQPSPGTCGF